MTVQRWKVVRGDWRSRLIGVAQVAIGIVALLGLVTMAVRGPLFLLAFAAAQGLILVAIVLFVIVAFFSQRTLVLEQYGAGEEIVRQGEVGREVYIVKSGTVAVLMKRQDGTEERVKSLGPGDHFGEMGLLRETGRNATVRACTAVEVFSMSPANFFSLYTHFPALREQIDKIMEDRLKELPFGK
ncbi:MAG TPA: cyclic nucleotide-binding domain-containing protein [Syntrophorhabdales bacterium]|nr:cyclic nucleotide-binding domain-containing protein [Syntrophorhabdales bacterium]